MLVRLIPTLLYNSNSNWSNILYPCFLILESKCNQLIGCIGKENKCTSVDIVMTWRKWPTTIFWVNRKNVGFHMQRSHMDSTISTTIIYSISLTPSFQISPLWMERWQEMVFQIMWFWYPSVASKNIAH